ncbi:MAG: hypothetical protein QOJ64_4090 [Acidobacteriota bacterium]|nr:hypothetical protein [Acidobacteriota bacterium]
MICDLSEDFTVMEAVIENIEPLVTARAQPISSEEVGEIIRQIEEKHDLLQYEVDGWCIWPVLRFPVALDLMKLPFAVTKESFKFRELCAIAVKDSYRLLFPRRARYVALTLSSELMEQVGERFKNVFFDELLPELGSYFKIETLNNKSFLPRAKAAQIKSDVTSTAFGLLSTLVLPRFGRHRDIRRVAEKLSESLGKEPGLEGFSSSRIAARLDEFYWRKKLFSSLFGRIRPEFLLSADGFSDHSAIAAAKERGVEVCEFQHGGFLAGGPEYGWSSYASSYKSKMPIPDRLLLYGDYWKEQLEREGFWGTSLHAVGSLRMDQYRRPGLAKGSRHERAACRIVLTTQGVDTEKLISFVDEFLRIAEQKLELDLYIKLHPAYESSKEIYVRSFGADSRVRVIAGSEGPSTFELISGADLHLSISSTCHYDALGLGVPTVILPLANCGWVLPLFRRGHALLAETPEALLAIARDLEHHTVPDSLSAYYYKPGAMQNMKQALKV